MEPNTQSNNPISRHVDAYWRRRFFILAVGLVLFGIVIWATSGGGGPARPAGGTAAPRADVAARHSPNALPPAAEGSPSPLPGGSPSASPAPTAAGPSGTGSAGTGSGGTGSGGTGSGGTAEAGTGARCAPGSIVLSLFPSQQSYTAGQRPTFDVYAVSTASAPCEMAYGPPLMRVLVTRNGQVVWDSARCAAAAAPPKTVSFSRGVPRESALSWDRKAASPACKGSLPGHVAGTYEVVAMLDGRSSPVRSFRLSG